MLEGQAVKSGCFGALTLTTVTDSSEEEKDMDLQCVLNVESAGGLVEMKKSSVTARGFGWKTR